MLAVRAHRLPVDLARQVCSRFDDKIVFMVGAGKMDEVTLKHLLAHKPRELWVTNRTQARADELADRIRARTPRAACTAAAAGCPWWGAARCGCRV